MIKNKIKTAVFAGFVALHFSAPAKAADIEEAYKAVERISSCNAWNAFTAEFRNSTSIYRKLGLEQAQRACVPKTWSNKYPGGNYDLAAATVSMKGGGAVVVGTSFFRSEKMRVMRVDGSGKKVWDKYLGGKKEDRGQALVKLSNGDILVGGSTRSKGAGYADMWLVRMDPSGRVIWDRTIGNAESQEINALVPTSDGGAIAAGTWWWDSHRKDLVVLRINKDGKVVWSKRLGGKEDEEARGISRTKDGGFFVSGITSSKGSGVEDAWIIRFNKDGQRIWDRAYGGKDGERAMDVVALPDGGAFFAGWSDTFSRKGTRELNSAWLVRIDPNGKRLWHKIVGTGEQIFSMRLLADGGLLLAGRSCCSPSRLWVARTDGSGNLAWEKRLHKGSAGFGKSISLADSSTAYVVGHGDPGNGPLLAHFLPLASKSTIGRYARPAIRPTINSCSHVYSGKVIRTKGPLGLGLIKWEVVGFSSSTGRVTIRDKAGAAGTREIACKQIPK